MRDDKWVKRWVVPSSTGEGYYTVAIDKDENYGCSCPGWVKHFPRMDCKHIIEVQGGGGRTLEEAVLDRLEGIKLI